MKYVYEVFTDLGWDGTVQYGIFSTLPKARAWIRRTEYNQVRARMNHPKTEDRSLHGLARDLLAGIESYDISEWLLDAPPREYE
jgi:hypothetical protein